MKVLVVSSMFPNNNLPTFGIFVKNRIRALSPHARMSVLAPVPFCPLVDRMARYTHRRGVIPHEKIDSLDIYHPRHFSIPMILKPLDGIFFYKAIERFVRRRGENFDLIDAHLAFPDGYAAVLLGQKLKIPVVITLRGHDIFELPKHPVRIRQVIWALKKAEKVFSVCRALKDGAVKLGVPAEKISVHPNGVFPDIFFPADRNESRRVLGLGQDKKIILSVGHLVRRKGFHHIIDALALLKKSGRKDILLVIVGNAGIEGNIKNSLREQIRRLGLAEQVLLAGAKPYAELYRWYNAADLFCLASSKEGWANVLLEALACGIPVVATSFWGNKEVVISEDLGILVDSQEPLPLSRALDMALEKKWDRDIIIDYARKNSWEKIAENIAREWKESVALN
jgi:glycosyltransferase involved in cell wall biosynthesis